MPTWLAAVAAVASGRLRGQAGGGVAVDEAAVAGRQRRQRRAIDLGLVVGGDRQWRGEDAGVGVGIHRHGAVDRQGPTGSDVGAGVQGDARECEDIPLEVEPGPIVAELPTCQKTFPAWALPIRTTDESVAVVSVVATWITKTALGLPWASRVSVPSTGPRR